MEDLLDELNGASVLLKLNLKARYHQVRLKEADEFNTTFRTHHGPCQFKVMPFGLTIAPATFQALVREIFGEYIRKFISVF